LGHYNGNTVNAQLRPIASDLEHEVTNAITLHVTDVNVTQPKWAPQPRGPLCFAHAAQSIATPLLTLVPSPNAPTRPDSLPRL